MTTHDPELTDRQKLQNLREQAQVLVQDIPGPLRKVSVSSGDSRVTVEWAGPDEPVARNGPAPQAGSTEDVQDLPEQCPDRVAVTAPLVGTFYRRPEPGAEPFVEEGSAVEAGQTVAIVEAMKLMNPVKAPGPGTVAAIKVDDAQMVEFDQTLMELDPPPTEDPPSS